jgi:Txe/YoeB family toxin of Txe-Axe toxin-antitoxin module
MSPQSLQGHRQAGALEGQAFRVVGSRRISLDDRLVYRVSGKPPDQALEIAQRRHHY